MECGCHSCGSSKISVGQGAAAHESTLLVGGCHCCQKEDGRGKGKQDFLRLEGIHTHSSDDVALQDSQVGEVVVEISVLSLQLSWHVMYLPWEGLIRGREGSRGEREKRREKKWEARKGGKRERGIGERWREKERCEGKKALLTFHIDAKIMHNKNILCW